MTMATKKQIAEGRARYEAVKRYAELAKDAETKKTNEACARFLVAALEMGNVAAALNALAHVYRIKGWNAYADWFEATAKFVVEVEVARPKTVRRSPSKRELAMA